MSGQFHKISTLPMGKEPLLCNSLVGFVGFSGALHVLQKRKLPSPYQESNPTSSCPHIFRLQKKAVRIITGSRPRDSCRELFKRLRILPLQSQNILSLLIFVVDNKNLFYVNSEIQSINTRQNFDLHQSQANLTLYQKGAHYSVIKGFNNLPAPSKQKKLILWC